MDCIKNAQNIMLYLDFNNEVQTDHLINKLISLRKTVTSPITIVKDRVLIPAQITDLEIVIVPAVAYSEDCYRLGYGGGYYDRFIERLRDDAVTIGIAFELQIFPEVPKAPHDAQLDYIVTESRILTPNK